LLGAALDRGQHALEIELAIEARVERRSNRSRQITVTQGVPQTAQVNGSRLIRLRARLLSPYLVGSTDAAAT
jgi:hypothetical protein